MHEIIEGAKTKWSFVPYQPGLVGGHCISIDPLYMAFQAKRHSVYPDLILAARKVNDGVTTFILQSMVKLLIMNKIDIHNVTVGLFGISYKKNTVDARNSLSLKLLKEIREYGFTCLVHDPLDHSASAHSRTELDKFDAMDQLSVAIILVGHDFYQDAGLKTFLDKCKAPNIVMDIPHLFINERRSFDDMVYWSL